MGYTKRRATLKWCYRNTKKIKYCSSAKFDEHLEKDVHLFLKSWLAHIFHSSNIEIDISDHPFTKDDIFKVIVTFTQRGTTIGTVFQ